MTVASGPILAGLHTRDETATEIGCSVRTILRWERQGLPVIRVGARRWHDPEAVRIWLLSHERRHEAPGRGARRR